MNAQVRVDDALISTSNHPLLKGGFEQNCHRLAEAINSGNLGDIVEQHENLIMKYYSDVQEQANQSFQTAKIISKLGFVVLIFTLFYAIGIDALARFGYGITPTVELETTAPQVTAPGNLQQGAAAANMSQRSSYSFTQQGINGTSANKPPIKTTDSDSVSVGKIGLISGVLIEFIAGVTFVLYARGAKQFGAFHICLERTHRYLLAYKIADGMGPNKDQTLKDLVCIMARAPMITRGDIESGGSNTHRARGSGHST